MGINPRERTSGHLQFLTSPFALFSHDDTNDIFRGGVVKKWPTVLTEVPTNIDKACEVPLKLTEVLSKLTKVILKLNIYISRRHHKKMVDSVDGT